MVKVALLIFFGGLFVPSFAFAQVSTSSTGLLTTAEEVYGSPAVVDIGTFVGSYVITPLFGVLGLIFLVLTIYGGILWMTAQGNEARVKKAKDILVQAIIGLFVILLAYGFTQFVFNALT